MFGPYKLVDAAENAMMCQMICSVNEVRVRRRSGVQLEGVVGAGGLVGGEATTIYTNGGVFWDVYEGEQAKSPAGEARLLNFEVSLYPAILFGEDSWWWI